jgi:L-lactate dehydrogenase complex protein LldG
MERNTETPTNKLPLQGAGGARERILAAVLQNQPDKMALPEISFFAGEAAGAADKFISTLTTIGGRALRMGSYAEIAALIQQEYTDDHRIISLVPELAGVSREVYEINPDAHHLENVDLAVLNAHFGVAENGAVWITEDLMGHRALPFITQHLAIVIKENSIVPTMHEAYQRIGDSTAHGFGSFIAGPSKTADIEQSLVIGAHGSRSMTVFLLQ